MKKIYEAFNIIPNNKEIYDVAFTHKSFCNENNESNEHYERIEWLGDSVLNLAVTKYIFEQDHNHSEGMMTLIRKNAVGNEKLAEFSYALNLAEFLRKGKSDDINSEKLHADLFESLIGALYLDKQHDVIEVVLESTVYRVVDQTIKNPDLLKNPKTILQEKIQMDSLDNVHYEVIQPSSQEFKCKVMIGDIVLGTGTGASKQKAEVAAASDALTKKAK